MSKGKKALLILGLGLGALWWLRRGQSGTTGSPFASFFSDAGKIQESATEAIKAADKAVGVAGKLNVAVNTNVGYLNSNPDLLKDYYRGTPLTGGQRRAARDAIQSNPTAAKAAAKAVQTESKITLASLKLAFQRGYNWSANYQNQN